MNPTPPLQNNHTTGNASALMLGAIINTLALVDATGFADYAMKAFIGGIIWLGFKVMGDYLSDLVLKKGKDNSSDK